MERRSARVSEAQWNILLDFLELNPNLVRPRGYNNSARGRAESSRLWQKVANLLHAEGSGTCKTPKDWSIYVSNYKSKLKKMVADLNTDPNGTGGGSPRESCLSDQDIRFLAIIGRGLEKTAPQDSINPFPDEDLQLSSISTDKIAAVAPPLQRRTRRPRFRSRPLAPLDEARRILSQVEMQRAAADAANADALNRIGENLGRLADAAERYLSFIAQQ